MALTKRKRRETEDEKNHCSFLELGGASDMTFRLDFLWVPLDKVFSFRERGFVVGTEILHFLVHTLHIRTDSKYLTEKKERGDRKVPSCLSP